MVWKKGKKPEQYLFTITEEFSKNWKSFKKEAKDSKQNISELLRNTVRTKLANDKKLSTLEKSSSTEKSEEKLTSKAPQTSKNVSTEKTSK